VEKNSHPECKQLHSVNKLTTLRIRNEMLHITDRSAQTINMRFMTVNEVTISIAYSFLFLLDM
jgi:hypothetical protein